MGADCSVLFVRPFRYFMWSKDFQTIETGTSKAIKQFLLVVTAVLMRFNENRVLHLALTLLDRVLEKLRNDGRVQLSWDRRYDIQ